MNLTPGPKDGCIRGEQALTWGTSPCARLPCPMMLGSQYSTAFAPGISSRVLTDLGHVSAHVVEAYKGCDGLLLEFNHEPELLAEGPIPRCSSAGSVVLWTLG